MEGRSRCPTVAGNSPPAGCRALATLSLLIGLGGLALGARGRVDSLLIGLLHLGAAYGLWTGVGWGPGAGLAAYGAGGLRALSEVPTAPVRGVLGLGFAVLAVAYLVRRRSHHP